MVVLSAKRVSHRSLKSKIGQLMVLARPTDVASISRPSRVPGIACHRSHNDQRVFGSKRTRPVDRVDQFPKRQMLFIRHKRTEGDAKILTRGAVSSRDRQTRSVEPGRPVPSRHASTPNGKPRNTPLQTGRGTNTGLNQLGIADDLAGFEIQSLSRAASYRTNRMWPPPAECSGCCVMCSRKPDPLVRRCAMWPGNVGGSDPPEQTPTENRRCPKNSRVNTILLQPGTSIRVAAPPLADCV